MNKKEVVRQAKQKSINSMVHKLPRDLIIAINTNSKLREAWEDITPLARNEWICWVISAKKLETRKHRVERTKRELLEGERRPCCWAGCPHRKFI
ncbi:MAG: YdeI/OmpD-associated family protein [Minisyncoccia bacterium]